jgi:opacity protein-like surface antigen
MKSRSKQLKALVAGVLILFLTSTAAAQQCVQPPAGLVSWWPGDGSADDIANGNDGTLQKGTTFAQGMVGQAFSLDGVDDYVQVPHHPSLNPASALTIEAWIHSASTEGPRVIVAKWNDDTGDWSVTVQGATYWDHSEGTGFRRRWHVIAAER